jgi:hypothetical protein
VWLEKPNFLVKAAEINAFQSLYYLWVDFGCFRSSRWGRNWTVHAERLPTHNRMLMLNAPGDHPTKQLAGTIFGGTTHAVRLWSHYYYTQLAREVRRGTFVGDDQILMSIVAQHHPRLVCRVTGTDTGDDPWWFLQHYVAGKTSLSEQCSQRQRWSPV